MSDFLIGKNFVIVPKVTTAQRNALSATNGMLVYDSDLNLFYKYENGSWSSFAGGGGSYARVVVSSNLTAANDTDYTLVANATFTDPTPSEGKGYSVLVRNGTATIGGSTYNTVGQLLWRIYHSGSWATYQLVTQTQLDAKQNVLGFTPENVANKQTDLTASATKYPTVDAVNTGLANCATLISSATASSSATIDFTLPNGYHSFEVRVIGLIPVTDNVGFWVRVSTDGGSTFASGASDYAYQRNIQNGTTAAPALTTADSKIILLGGSIGNGTGRYFNSVLRIWNNQSSSQYKNITGEFHSFRSDSIYTLGLVNGVYLSNTAINAIRILLSSGNISSGTFELWGYK